MSDLLIYWQDYATNRDNTPGEASCCPDDGGVLVWPSSAKCIAELQPSDRMWMVTSGKPDTVIASIMSGDQHVDSRYSDSDWVRGVRWRDGAVKRLLTTRSFGAITVASRGQGYFQITVNQR